MLGAGVPWLVFSRKLVSAHLHASHPTLGLHLAPNYLNAGGSAYPLVKKKMHHLWNMKSQKMPLQFQLTVECLIWPSYTTLAYAAGLTLVAFNFLETMKLEIERMNRPHQVMEFPKRIKF